MYPPPQTQQYFGSMPLPNASGQQFTFNGTPVMAPPPTQFGNRAGIPNTGVAVPQHTYVRISGKQLRFLRDLDYNMKSKV
jgi:hypothetical protein